MMNTDTDHRLIMRHHITAGASQQRPHLALQLDQLAENPGMKAYQVIGAHRMNLSDRRFLVKVVMILDHEWGSA